MDEEDGRLGPRARKFGPSDVLTDAFAGSLRWPFPARLLTGIHSDSFALNHLQFEYRMIHLNPQPCTAALSLGAEPAEGVRQTAGGGEAV